MSLSRFLKKRNRPSPAHDADVDAGTGTSSGINYSQIFQSRGTVVLSALWWKRTMSIDDRLSSLAPTSTSTLPSLWMTENPTTPEAGAPLPMRPTIDSGVSHTNLSMELLPEMVSGSVPGPSRLTEARSMAEDGPPNSNLNLNTRFNAVDYAVSTPPLQPLATTATGAMEQTAIPGSITDRTSGFSEGMPVLMKALDETKALHPFIGGVVLAFKTSFTLALKRRDTEKKILALFAGMKDMMGVLLLLKDVQGVKATAPDEVTIEDRLKTLVERTADDIKICSNVCDAYMKKRLLAKVILGPVWDAKLLDFVRLFATRRREFEFELSLHALANRGVDKASVKLDNIVHDARALTERMDDNIAMFQQLVDPEQKQLSALVAENGGLQALRDNDKVLLLLEKTANKATSTPSAEGHRTPHAKVNDVDDLKNDIFEDPGVATEKNQTVFFRKFEAQKDQIQDIDEHLLVIKRESDRVIHEVKGGPHERLLDRSVHEIWTDMGWRGIVKARHFVTALRDYYQERLTSDSDTIHRLGTSAITGSQVMDAWAIKYIDIIRQQPILEAIDEDASGFITVGEMNRFTASRPVDWSLLHWVAFWAVGFRESIINYAKQIEELFAKMEGVRATVLPPNREAIDDYFTDVWGDVHTLTAAVISLLPEPSDPEKFKPYLEAEEARLGTHLKAVDYIIDGSDTLTLITGVGCIEKTVFPLLYLLMKHHYEIMRIMRTKVVDSRELWYSVESILHVRDVIGYRVDDLAKNFSQQMLDPEKQFQNFAHGIFKYFHNEKALWSVNYVRSLDPSVIEYNDSAEDQNAKPEDVLRYEYADNLSLDYWVYDGHSIYDTPNYRNDELPLKDILGHWNGYFYDDNGMQKADRKDSMVTLVLEPAEGKSEVKANAWSNRGRHAVTGSWSKKENGVLQIQLKMTFTFWSPVFFSGHFDPERNALTGVWDGSADSEASNGRMEFRRILPRHLTTYPSIKELLDNKPRTLWTFAITAVRNDIRRDSWSWSFFSQRRDDRETMISLTIRCFFFGTPLDDDEHERLCKVLQSLTPADACFYSSKINRIRTNTWVHTNIWCDSCYGCIGGARLFCLDCVNKDSEAYDSLDLCSRPECVAAHIANRKDLKGVHEPNHRLVKVRTVVLARQRGHVYNAAINAFARVEKFCMQVAEASGKPETVTRSNLKNAPSSEPTCDRLSDGPPMQDGAESISQPPLKSQSGGRLTCGNCKGALSFPLWYCIFCEDDLFICDSCDKDGVPDLTYPSGEHTEEHHLIRCLAPEKAKEATSQAISSTEQRLMSLEKRFDSMLTRFDNIDSRLGNIEQLLHRLASKIESL